MQILKKMHKNIFVQGIGHRPKLFAGWTMRQMKQAGNRGVGNERG
jgi:hypothetical protein